MDASPARQPDSEDLPVRAESAPLQRVRVPKTSEVVADKFRAQIVRGELLEGDFLPPEGQLMATLGISRPTLREAFRILEAENLISVVRGSRTGARVHAPRPDLVARYAGYVLQAQKTTVADLYEARLAIEPHIVRRLASQHDPEAIAALRQEVARLRQLISEERYIDFMTGVAEFHRVLVAAGGNKTLTFLNNLLLDMAARHQVDRIRRDPITTDERRKALLGAVRSYEKLIGLVEAGDIDAADAHWRLHLNNAAASWAGSGEGERIVDALGH